MMMRQFLFCLVLLLPIYLGAQITPRPDGRVNSRDAGSSGKSIEEMSFSERLVKGGGLQAQFGNLTILEVSPTLGYKLTKRWVAGVGANYLYFRENYAGIVRSFNVWGTRGFTYYQLLDNVIGYTELERLSVPGFNPLSGQPERYSLLNHWIGAGFRQWMGPRVALDALLLYNTLYRQSNVNNIYASPFTYRLTVSFGL